MYSTLCFQNVFYFCLFNEACQTFLNFCTLEICRTNFFSCYFSERRIKDLLDFFFTFSEKHRVFHA